MKLYKNFLRIWIGVVSVASFLAGWVFLAHSGKPVAFGASSNPSNTSNVVQPVNSTTSTTDPNAIVPTLPPLPTLQSGSTTSNSQPVQLQAPSIQIQTLPHTQFLPQLRTRGS